MISSTTANSSSVNPGGRRRFDPGSCALLCCAAGNLSSSSLQQEKSNRARPERTSRFSLLAPSMDRKAEEPWSATAAAVDVCILAFAALHPVSAEGLQHV